MNLYGELIRKLRQDNNITQEELANILLISSEKMAQVEAGQELLTDSELTLCANVLDASSAALKKGYRHERYTIPLAFRFLLSRSCKGFLFASSDTPHFSVHIFVFSVF